MNILPKLPDHLFAKVMLFHSHPAADLVKESMVFHYYKFKNDATPGGPFFRGGSDAYYYRGINPHYWTNGNGRDGTVYDLTPPETDAYMMGYFGTNIRKSGEHLEGSLHVLLLRFMEN